MTDNPTDACRLKFPIQRLSLQGCTWSTLVLHSSTASQNSGNTILEPGLKPLASFIAYHMVLWHKWNCKKLIATCFYISFNNKQNKNMKPRLTHWNAIITSINLTKSPKCTYSAPINLTFWTIITHLTKKIFVATYSHSFRAANQLHCWIRTAKLPHSLYTCYCTRIDCQRFQRCHHWHIKWLALNVELWTYLRFYCIFR